MTSAWSGRSQANPLGYRIFIWLIRYGGLKPAYFLLRFVSIYYLLFSTKANSALIEFYTRAKIHKPTLWRHRYQTYNLFGEALIDKIATYTEANTAISFDFENEQELHRLAASGRGAILMGAHLGNWEIASQLMHRINAKVYVLMLENEHEKIKSLLDKVISEKSFEVITLTDDITMILKIKAALDEGAFICMHADRYLNQKRTLPCEFLGHQALIPEGPFYLAAKLRVPVSYVYAVKQSGLHYQFSCTDALESRDLLNLASAYIRLLEQKALAHPHQWYNFYPYWS